uniref:Uncharacterized protein n=1 Tax=Octopus bimaculoides TaxID=37653 RepID=A0A0L8I9P8_OCTBM
MCNKLNLCCRSCITLMKCKANVRCCLNNRIRIKQNVSSVLKYLNGSTPFLSFHLKFFHAAKNMRN